MGCLVAWLACAVATLLPASARAQRPPDTAALRLPAPDSFIVRFSTTKGTFDVMARRNWSPLAVDRLYHLVGHDYFTSVPFYRVVPGFVAQFGITTSQDINSAWAALPVADEPVMQSNTRGRMHFARSGPATRSADFAIMLIDNNYLDAIDVQGVTGFPPVAEVVSGMAVVDSLYSGYREQTLEQFDSLFARGKSWLSSRFPLLDYIDSARVVMRWPEPVLRTELGEATYYADLLVGRRTASGVVFDNSAMYAAHRTLPFGTRVRVVNLSNERSVIVEVVDRGPNGTSERARNTIIDVSRAAAELLGFVGRGRTNVRLEVLPRS
jgi:peptidyl-prolyl cis-trans isomerase A (cyclophilin A)